MRLTAEYLQHPGGCSEISHGLPKTASELLFLAAADEPADDVHNPLRKRRPEADDISEAGGNNITPVMATADQLSSGATSSAQV